MEKVKGLTAAVGTGITYLFGGWETALTVLIVFMSLDFLTGLIKGAITKELASNVGYRGIAKKAVIFVVLIVAVMLDRLMNNGTWMFRTLVCYFYIANEGISILENCAVIGLPIPEKIKELLAQLKDSSNQGDVKEQLK